jgi:hypothetical protein
LQGCNSRRFGDAPCLPQSCLVGAATLQHKGIRTACTSVPA